MSMRGACLLLGLLILAVHTATRSFAADPTTQPAPGEAFAVADVQADGSPVGVGVHMRGGVAHPKLGGSYELYYQIRLHTRAGDVGPLLGDKEMPAGRAYLVRRLTCESAPLEFDEELDITRAQISGMSQLPSRQEGKSDLDVVLRIEPQIYDVAAQKYLTDARTSAAILVADVGAASKVYRLQSLSGWLVMKSHGGWDSSKTIELFSTIDVYDPIGNHIPEAVEQVLDETDATPQTKAMYITALPAETLKIDVAYNLVQKLKALAASDNAEIKAAATKKLGP